MIRKTTALPSLLKMLPTICGAVAISYSIAANAHHAFSAEFDADKALDLSGVVTKVRWVNPHSWLYFDVKDKDGAVTNWGVEFGSPNQLANAGLTKADVVPGAPVHIKGYKAKNGGPFGYSVTVTLADGRVFKTGGAQDSPTAAAAAGAN